MGYWPATSSQEGRCRVGYIWGSQRNQDGLGWDGADACPPLLLTGAWGTLGQLRPHGVCCVGLRSSGRQAARLFSVPHAVQRETTLAYLESQVAAALTLRSSHEYRHWLLLYARYLVNEGEAPGGPSSLSRPAQPLSLLSLLRCSGLGPSELWLPGSKVGPPFPISQPELFRPPTPPQAPSP